MCPQESLPRRPGHVGWRFGFLLWPPMPLSLSFPSCKMGDDSISLVARLLVQLPAVTGAPWTLNVSRPAVRSLSGGPFSSAHLPRRCPPKSSQPLCSKPGKNPDPQGRRHRCCISSPCAEPAPRGPMRPILTSIPGAGAHLPIVPGGNTEAFLFAFTAGKLSELRAGPSPLPALHPVAQGEHKSMLPGSHLRSVPGGQGQGSPTSQAWRDPSCPLKSMLRGAPCLAGWGIRWAGTGEEGAGSNTCQVPGGWAQAASPGWPLSLSLPASCPGGASHTPSLEAFFLISLPGCWERARTRSAPGGE